MPATLNDTSADLVSFAFSGDTSQHDERPLYIDADQPSRAIYGSGFRRLVCSLVAGLKAYGLQPGECVLVQLSGNTVIHPALFFGIIGAGGVYMCCNPSTTRYEMEHLITLAAPRLILTHPGALPIVLPVCTNAGIAHRYVGTVDEQSIDRLVHFTRSTPACVAATADMDDSVPFPLEHLLAFGEEDWIRLDISTAQRTPATMFMTSGTSGLPKGAVRSHYALISQYRDLHYEVPFPVTRLAALPLHHLLGELWTSLFPIRYGQPVYIMRRFDMTGFLDAVSRFKITETYLVPTMVHILTQSTLPVGSRLASLRYVGVAGAPIDGGIMKRFQALLHLDAYVTQFYGMTELAVITQNRYGDTYPTGSIGCRRMGYELRLINPDNGTVITEDDCPGEVWVRGPGMLLEYKGHSDSLQNGWFRTGDMVYTKNGHYFMMGRFKELIKVRGYSVAPAEIEAVILEHPAVQDVAVIRVTVPDGSTEIPRAYVVPIPGVPQPTADEITAAVMQKLAWYKSLEGGVVFVSSVPRTVSGKVQRTRLMELDAQRDKLALILACA